MLSKNWFGMDPHPTDKYISGLNSFENVQKIAVEFRHNYQAICNCIGEKAVQDLLRASFAAGEIEEMRSAKAWDSKYS